MVKAKDNFFWCVFLVFLACKTTVLWYFYICKDNLVMWLAAVWSHVSMVFIITTAGVKPGSANPALLGNKLQGNSGRSGCHKDWGRPFFCILGTQLFFQSRKWCRYTNDSPQEKVVAIACMVVFGPMLNKNYIMVIITSKILYYSWATSRLRLHNAEWWTEQM